MNAQQRTFKRKASPSPAEDAVCEFSHKAVFEIRMAALKAKYAIVAKQWSCLPTLVATRSYAQVASVCSAPQVFVPVVKKVEVRPRAETARQWGKRDFALNEKARNDERAANNELAKCIAERYSGYHAQQVQRTKEKQANNLLIASITARYAKQVLPPTVPFKISRESARADYKRALAVRQAQRRYNLELASCIAFRYAEKYDEYVHAPKVAWRPPKEGIERSIRGPCTAKRQPKAQKVVVEEDWDELLLGLQTSDFPGLSRKVERVSLLAALKKTSLGRSLLMCYFTWKIGQKGFAEELREIVSAVEKLQPLASQEEKDVPVAQMDISNPEESTGKFESSQRSSAVVETGPVMVETRPTERGFYAESSSMDQQVFSVLTDRWIKLSNVRWTTMQMRGRPIGRIDLPYNVINNFRASQNAAMFLQHRFFRSNIVMRFQLNSTRFHVGMLVASVFYSEPGGSGYNQTNFASALQRQHVKILAGAPYAGELHIPYQFPNSAMTIDSTWNFCSVHLYVVNPLMTSSNTANELSISIDVAFEDAQFNGVIARNSLLGHAEPQMDSITNIAKLAIDPSVNNAINAATGVLQTLGSDANRDNPPIPLQPMSFIPQGVGSFCNVDNIMSPVNVLRADATGQVPYRMNVDDMRPEILKSTWGLLDTFQWKFSDTESTELWKVPVAPLLPISRYPRGVPPPIAMLASLHGFWRGSLEFKVEIIANAFYQGRLMVTGVPLATELKPPSLSVAQFSSNATFSISDAEEKVFTFPWNWTNSFAKTRSLEDEFESIGLLQIFVKNSLVAIEGVPNTVYVNIYVRGGPDFEQAIVRPSLLYFGTQEAIKPPDTQSPIPYNLESAWYTTYAHNVVSKSGKYPVIPYIQNITNGWVGYTHLRPGYIYKIGKTLKGRDFRVYIRTDAAVPRKVVQVQYGTYDSGLSTDNAHGMIVSHSKVLLAKYVAKIKAGKSVEEARNEVTDGESNSAWVADGDWSQVKDPGSSSWVTATDKTDPPVWEWVTELGEDDDSIPQHRYVTDTGDIVDSLEEAEMVVVPQMHRAVRFGKPTPLTRGGLAVFGENALDLKSHCRRFNLLGSISIPTCTEGLSQDCKYAAVVRVNPIRTITISSSASFNNRYQEGPISAIGEMYRFWRGALRYRIVVSGNPPEGTQMFVSHRFDKVSYSQDSIALNPNLTIESKDDMLHTQYASYCQTLSVNQAFTIEVPYYQEKEYLSTLINQDLTWTDNGSLQIWCFSKVKANIDVEIYYSFADDTHYKLFQGLGIAKDISTIAPEPLAYAQMSVNPFDEPAGPSTAPRVTLPASHQLPIWHDNVDLERPAIGQGGIVSYVKKRVTSASNAFTGSVKNVVSIAKSMGRVSKALENFSNQASKAKEGLSSFWNAIWTSEDVLVDIVINIFYALTSHSLMHASLAIFNIYRKVFIGVKEKVDWEKWYDIVTNFLEHGPESLQHPQAQSDIEPEYDAIASLGSMLFSALSSMCSVATTPPTSFKGLRQGLFDFSHTARSTTFVKKYIMDFLEFTNRVFKMFTARFAISSDEYNLISGTEDTRLQAWLIDAIHFTTSDKELIKQSPKLSLAVFELEIVGRAFLVAAVNDGASSPKLCAYIQKVQKDLVTLAMELRMEKVFSSVRYEPAIIWIAGEQAGVGKSRLMAWLMEEWAKHTGITMPNFYHSISPGSKHGDGMENKPMVVIDDARTLSAILDAFFTTFMLQGKSGVVYQPPMAALHLKGAKPIYKDGWISSNLLYWTPEAGILSVDAFNRRRTILLHCQFRDGYDAERVRKMDQKDLHECKQMKAALRNVMSPTVEPRHISFERASKDEPYNETIRNEVFKILDEYHAAESVRYLAACKRMEERISTAQTEAEKTFMGQLTAFKKLIQVIEEPGTVMPDLNPWLTDMKKSASFDPITTPVAQMDDPKQKEMSYLNLPCLHYALDPMKTAFSEKGDFIDMRSESFRKVKVECTHNVCYVDRTFKLRLLSNEYNKRELKMLLKRRLNRQAYDPVPFPIEWFDECFPLDNSSPKNRLECDMIRLVSLEQLAIRDDHLVINGQPLPKEPIGWKTKVWNAICDILGYLTAILARIMVVIAILAAIKKVSRVFDSPKPQLHPSGDYITLKNAKSIKHKAMQLVKPEMAERINLEDVKDPFDDKLKMIQNNTIFLLGTDPNTGATYRGRCLGLFEKEVLVVKHYFDVFIKAGIKTLSVIRPHTETTIFKVDLEDLVIAWGDCGYGVMSLPRSFPTQFRKITQLFASEKLATEYPSTIKIFEIGGIDCKTVTCEMSLVNQLVVPANNKFEEWTIYDGFKYPWGGAGRCGSIILSPTLAAPIIGIHTAGIGTKIGYGERLYRESFEIEPVKDIEYVTPQLDTESSVYMLEGSYTEVGRIDKDLVPQFPKETCIVPSEISPVFQITTEPAPLSANDPRLEEAVDILKIGASKRCDPIKEFPKELVEQAYADLRHDIIAHVKPIRGNIGLLSISQAIEGLQDKTGPIVMSTSEGFPWRSLRPKGATNKKWLFQLSESQNGIKVDGIWKELHECLVYKHQQRLQGKVPASYFTCCLKDARILKEKVKIPGKTRIFEMSPIELTIAQRQYCYDFVSSYMQSRFEHAIGINPDGQEWSDLANSLYEFSPYIITADYSAYGPRLNSELLYRAFEITSSWYQYWMDKQGNRDDELIRAQQVLAHEVAHGLHIVGDLVFRPASGLPSGNIETVTKNSQCNSLYIRIAYLGLAASFAPHYADLYWFKQFVKLYTYGDDLIMSVKEEIIEWFNNDSLIKFFALYRLKMTDALKSGFSRPFCALEEATFLKRGFLRHPTRPGQWLAPLERASITDTVNWIHKSINPRDASMVNAEMSCRLAYTLGPLEFSKICSRIKAVWLDKGVNFQFPSWESLDAHVWEGTPGPKFSF